MEDAMRNHVLTACLVTLLVTGWGLSASAGETAYRFDPVSQKSRPLIFTSTYPGFVVFKEKCKSCHIKDNDKGAPFLHTEPKTERAWRRVFLKKYRQKVPKMEWIGIRR